MTKTAAAPAETPPAALPLFYKKPVLLRFEDHATTGLRSPGDFSFARAAIAIPVSLGEFAAVQRCYPIVFSSDDLHAPLAVMGLKEGENLFIDEAGHWQGDCYVPAYVRRYPFIAADAGDGKTKLLTIDTGSDRFVADTAEEPKAARLFDDKGGPTPAAREAMAFCHAVQEDHARTTAFVAALMEAKLLTDKHAQMAFPDGTRYTLDGFMVVDDAAWKRLPAKTLSDWRDHGWLDAVALHRASGQCWKALLDRQVGLQSENSETK
ncbi:SapC family protein [Brevundimonas sp.]|uniref:SapC family protein n=1 Tax=Brevundimonas sp. TaxID=1871086 RepID=UPI0028ABA13F|nr:SapC family protein [Brevundimonas sp.]